MTYRDFDEFLMHKCIDDNPTILDDDLPDFFEDWITEIEKEDIITYAEQYGIAKKIEGLNMGIKEIEKIRKTLNVQD